jgi:hypothetical protein
MCRRIETALGEHQTGLLLASFQFCDGRCPYSTTHTRVRTKPTMSRTVLNLPLGSFLTARINEGDISALARANALLGDVTKFR